MSDEQIRESIRRMATNPFRSLTKNIDKNNNTVNQRFVRSVNLEYKKQQCEEEISDNEQFGSFKFYEKNYLELKNIQRILGNDPQSFCVYFMNLTPKQKQLFMGGSNIEINTVCIKNKNILMLQSTQNRIMLNKVKKYYDCMNVKGGQKSVASQLLTLKATKSLRSEDEFGKRKRHIKSKKSRKPKKRKTRKSPL